MYCRNCGNEVKDGARFCPKCGASLIPAAAEDTAAGSAEETNAALEAGEQPNPPMDVIPPYEDSQTAEAPAKRKRRKIWIPIVVIIIAAAVVVFFLLEYFSVLPNFFAKDQTVDLNDYVSLEYDGYDGYGTAEVRFDTVALGEDFDKEIKLTRQAKDQGYDSFSDLVGANVEMSVGPVSGLSTGDEVIVEWVVSPDAFDEMVRNDLVLLCEPMTDTVSGLAEIRSFDAFGAVTVEFSGISPDAAAEIAYVEDPADIPEGAMDYLSFSLSQTDGLTFGDNVAVTIDASGAEELKADLGVYPEELSREYTVGGIPYFAFSLDQIPEETMEQMRQQAEDLLADDFESWGEDEQLLSMDYLGCYFLYKKPGADVSDVNMIYQVYKVNARDVVTDEDDEEVTSDFSYYWYCGYFDGMVLEDGSYSMDLSDYEDCYNKFYRDGYDEEEGTWTVEDFYCYNGFEDPDSMFDYLVTSEMDDYTYESTVQE